MLHAIHQPYSSIFNQGSAEPKVSATGIPRFPAGLPLASKNLNGNQNNKGLVHWDIDSAFNECTLYHYYRDIHDILYLWFIFQLRCVTKFLHCTHYIRSHGLACLQ